MQARHFVWSAALLILPCFAAAQSARIELPLLTDVRGKATESVDVNLGWWALHFVSWMVDDHDADSAALKRVIKALKSVQIRNYQFASDVACPKADLDALRSQLRGPPWVPVVQVKDRVRNEDVDVYVAIDNHTVHGATIIACEPRELTILNLVGPIDLDQIVALRRTFTPRHGRDGSPATPDSGP